MTAAKVSMLLHVWKSDPGEEITAKTMRTAIELARWLAQESSATACACAAAEQDRAIQEEAKVMLGKLVNFGRPLTRRELYRKYDDESRHLHDPALELLMANGQVRWVDARPEGRLEPAPETSRGHL